MTTWENDLTVGVRFMDDEHAGLHASLIDFGALVEAPLPTTASHIVRTTRATGIQLRLHRLRLELSAHFTHKEQIMYAYDYPGTSEHTAAHATFLGELDGMSIRYATGDDAIPARVVSFVHIWFARHSTHSDLQLSDWLLQHHPHVSI